MDLVNAPRAAASLPRRAPTAALALASLLILLLSSSSLAVAAANSAGTADMGVASPSPYAAVDARNAGLEFRNLPGFTRGAYERDHALITPESRVYTGMFGWKNTDAAWLVTPAMAGAPQFSMYQVRRLPRSPTTTRPLLFFSLFPLFSCLSRLPTHSLTE